MQSLPASVGTMLLILVGAVSAAAQPTNLNDGIDNLLSNPEKLNTALAKAWDKNPLGLKFKLMQVEGGEDTLGISYDLAFDIKDLLLDGSEKFNHELGLDFSTSGNIAFDQAANPQDFIQSKLSFASTWWTNINNVPEETGNAVATATKAIAQGICGDCKAEEWIVDNGFASALGSFSYFQLGLEAGFESDQSFDKSQATISAFAFAQIEDWSRSGVLGKLGLTPALRLGFDHVDPNAETPRSLAGDTSNFYRFSGEFSAKMPINPIGNLPLYLSANYRYYMELGASTVVKTAGLDQANLFTVAVSGPKGVYVSYSTGKLPFDVDKSNVVELGWQVHF